MRRNHLALLSSSVFILATTPLAAHAVLIPNQGRAQSSLRAAVAITHGCQGSPTTSVRVTIPEGVVAARPMPKPGWTLTMVKGPYARSYAAFHEPLSAGVKEITWSGASLPDDQYDEFVFSAYVSDAFAPGTTVYFPVLQTCRDGQVDWAQIPAEGQSAHDLKSPAPGLRLAAANDAMPAATVTQAGALRIEAPWLRATPGGAKVAAGYLRITNNGREADRLLGASAPMSDRIEVHEMSMADGVMKMRAVDNGLEIAPGATIDLKPGGFHLMLQDLSGALKAGDKVPVTLRFEKAGEVTVPFPVGGLGGASGAGEHVH